MKGYIYMHTTPSGKKYIGQTYNSLDGRWANGKGYKGYFGKIIKKYG